MNKFLSFLPVVFISSTVFAGSYNFECTGYSLNKASGQISEISFNRNGDSEGNLFLLDPNVDLLSDVLHFQDKSMRLNMKVTVRSTSTISDLVGSMGKREHYVKVSAVNISTDTDGYKETYAGTCTETTVTTCGGSCD